MESVEEIHRRIMSRESRYAAIRREGKELVAEDGGWSLWTKRVPATYKDYWHVIGMNETHIGGFRDDREAVEYWRRLVEAEREAGRR